jgi:hypothetical protein
MELVGGMESGKHDMYCSRCSSKSKEVNEAIKFNYQLTIDGEASTVTLYGSGWTKHQTEEKVFYICPEH